MKTIVGKVSFAAAVACLSAPLISFAQNIASPPGTVTVTRDIGRLTLLTGPNLLSPPHGAPQSTARVSIAPPDEAPAAPAFRFVPSIPRHSTARRPAAFDGVLTPASFAPTKDAVPPNAESLRFNATVPTIPTALPSGKTSPVKRE